MTPAQILTSTFYHSFASTGASYPRVATPSISYIQMEIPMEAEKDNFRAGDPQWEFAVKAPQWRFHSEGSAVKAPQRRLRSENLRSENLRTENFNRYLTLNNAHFHHDLNHASMSKYCPSIVYQGLQV